VERYYMHMFWDKWDTTMVSKFQPNGYCQVLNPVVCSHIGECIHQPIIMLTSKIQPNECCPLRATCIGSPRKMDSSAYNTIYLVSPCISTILGEIWGEGGPSLALSTWCSHMFTLFPPPPYASYILGRTNNTYYIGTMVKIMTDFVYRMFLLTMVKISS
jgi:hypothetical protein